MLFHTASPLLRARPTRIPDSERSADTAAPLERDSSEHVSRAGCTDRRGAPLHGPAPRGPFDRAGPAASGERHALAATDEPHAAPRAQLIHFGRNVHLDSGVRRACSGEYALLSYDRPFPPSLSKTSRFLPASTPRTRPGSRGHGIDAVVVPNRLKWGRTQRNLCRVSNRPESHRGNSLLRRGFAPIVDSSRERGGRPARDPLALVLIRSPS